MTRAIPGLLAAGLLLAGPGWPAPPERAEPAPERGPPPVEIGAGIVASPSPYKGVSSHLTPVPVLNLQRGRFSLRGIQAAFRLAHAGPWAVSAVAQPRLQSYHSGESRALSGMEDRRWTAEAGLRAGARAGPWSLQMVGLTDLLDRHGGAEVTAGVSYRLVTAPRLQLAPGAGAVWQSAELVGYYYGVRPGEARPGRPAYSGSAAASPYASLLARLDLGGRWGLFAYLRHTWLDEAVTDSPIVARESTYTGILAVTYAFP